MSYDFSGSRPLFKRLLLKGVTCVQEDAGMEHPKIWACLALRVPLFFAGWCKGTPSGALLSHCSVLRRFVCVCVPIPMLSSSVLFVLLLSFLCTPRNMRQRPLASLGVLLYTKRKTEASLKFGGGPIPMLRHTHMTSMCSIIFVFVPCWF